MVLHTQTPVSSAHMVVTSWKVLGLQLMVLHWWHWLGSLEKVRRHAWVSWGQHGAPLTMALASRQHG